MDIVKITLVGGDTRDEPVELLINGYSIISANYDEHGSVGMDLVKQAADRISTISKVEIEYHEDHSIFGE